MQLAKHIIEICNGYLRRGRNFNIPIRVSALAEIDNHARFGF